MGMDNQAPNSDTSSGESASHSPLREFAASRETPALDVEEISAIVVDCGYRLHIEAGPGLLESVYEVVLARMLEERGPRSGGRFPCRSN
jgi:hypothetical protein